MPKGHDPHAEARRLSAGASFKRKTKIDGRLFRRQNHRHLPPFHQRLGLDFGEGQGLGADPVEQLEAEILMRHFAAAETQSHLDLVAFLEKAAHGLHLDLVIVVVDAGTQLDFLDLDDFLALARFGGFLLLEEAEFAEIENFTDRRTGVGHDLDQVEPRFLRELQSVCNGHDAAIVTFGVDQLNFPRPYIAVCQRSPFLWSRYGLHRTTNGLSPLAVSTNVACLTL